MGSYVVGQTKIRVGIVGIAPDRGWSAKAHIPALRSLDEFELAAVATTSEESARAAARHFDVPLAFGDPLEMIGRTDLDLIVVSVRVTGHHALVKAALEAGKHVYCEWPLGRDTAEAIELRDLARSRGVCAVVGLQARGAPSVAYVRDLVAEGYVGEILSCTMISTVPAWGLLTEAANVYTLDRRNRASILTIAGGHSFDLLAYCAGEFRELAATVAVRRQQVKLHGSGETVNVDAPDQVAVTGTLESGAVAIGHVQGGTPHATKFLLEINGSQGALVLSDRGPLSVQMAPLTLLGAPAYGEPLRELSVPERYRQVPFAVPSGPPFNVAQLYAGLATRIRGGSSVLPDFATAVIRHRTIDAIERAAITGLRQTLESRA